jgi:hypothetical protein
MNEPNLEDAIARASGGNPFLAALLCLMVPVCAIIFWGGVYLLFKLVAWVFG